MKATVTFNEEKNIPVLTLTTETPEEDRELSLISAFSDIKIVLELNDSDELIFLNK